MRHATFTCVRRARDRPPEAAQSRLHQGSRAVRIARVLSFEEMNAGLSAAYMCGSTGIENRTLDNSAAYLAGWVKRLHADRKLIVHAAAQTQRAGDYVLGVRSSG